MSGNMIGDVYNPAANADELILRWLRRARESQENHYEKAVYFDHWNFWFGVPVIIITAVVSASVFGTMQEQATGYWKYIAMAVSLISVVATSLQTFLNFPERAERHRAIASEYGAIRRRLELVNISSSKDLVIMEKLGDDLSAIASRAPSISQSFFRLTRPRPTPSA